MELAGKRQREDSSEDADHEPLLSKRQFGEVNDRTSAADRDKTPAPMHKANGNSYARNNDQNTNAEKEEEEEELSNENTKMTSAKSNEEMDDVDFSGKNYNGDKAHKDASIARDDVQQKSKSVNDKDYEEDNAEKNAARSEENEEVDDNRVSLSKAKSSGKKQPARPSVSKSKTKDPEVVDGLEMSVECASDKEQSSSDPEDEEDKRKTRPIMIFLKTEPNEWEFDASTSEAEKSVTVEKREGKKTKVTTNGVKGTSEGKGRKRGKKGFTKVAVSSSDDSDDDASQDEDYTPRTKKKMKKAFPARNTWAKSPGRRRGRAPKKVAKLSDDEHSDEQNDDEQKSKKPKEKALKKSAGSEDRENSDDKINEIRKNGKKNSITQSEDDRTIQALKKYLSMAGIRIKSYEQFWAGCKTNAARLARMKEALALQGVVGRPTMDKCKKAKARMELKNDVDPLGLVDNVKEENTDEDVPILSPIKRNKKGQTVHRRERMLIVNLYKDLKFENPGVTKRAAHSILSKKTGFGIFSIKNTLLEYESTGTVTSPNMKKRRIPGNQLVNEFDRNAIRRKFHEFFTNKEVPTLQKLLHAVNDDKDLPNFKRTTFWKLSKELNLRFPST